MSDLYTSKTGLSTTFSGSDIVIVFGDEYVGECLSFTLGINREAGPQYVLGRKTPISINKGKRGIGGSFVLAQLGYDALIQYHKSIQSDPRKQKVWVRKDEIVMQVTGEGPDVSRDPRTTSGGSAASVSSAAKIAKVDLWQEAEPFYVDQIQPFNVTIIGNNEQGDQMALRVHGVTILNNGIGLSIDELNLEQRYTFVAHSVAQMKKLY